jgi:hypothetical protein
MNFSLEEPKRILDELRTSLANMESWWMAAQKINPDFSPLSSEHWEIKHARCCLAHSLRKPSST